MVGPALTVRNILQRADQLKGAREHVNRMANDLAPDWPSASRDGTYRIICDGDPSF